MSYNVKDIAKTLKDNKKQGTPVVIFTGAGCSKSAGMPLANELIAEINKKHKGNLRSLSEQDKKDYGLCMSKLTPHEQKTLIEKHITKAKINWAHIALASLLKNGYLGKVLTFNFDNILNRACSLDNFFPPIYDLKVLSEEYFTAIPNQSIVHLHGQWSGFQLANSDADTLSQANKLKNYIKNTINTSPTLFIGYSGGADAFFQLVQENFIGQHRLYWIDYGKEPNANVKQFLEVNPNHRNFIGEQDADKFLLELAIELKCFPTELFKDPIKHLKEICEYVNNFPLNTPENEIDILEDTKRTLAIADASKPAITQLKLVELLHTQKFETIINQTKNLDLGLKPISKIVASAYLGKSLTFLTKDDNQFQNNFDKAIKLEPNFYQAYAKVGDQLVHSSKKQDLVQAKLFYEKCFSIKSNLRDDTVIGNFAVVLTKLAILDKNEILFNQSFKQFEKALKIEPDDPVHLGNYGNALFSLGKLKEDEHLFNKAFEQYKKALNIQPDHINNLGNYGNSLSDLAKLKEDEDLFNKAFELYEKALKIQPDHTDHLGNYGTALSDLATLKEDEDLFNKAFELYEKALKIQPDHADHLGNYGTTLLDLAKLKEDEDLFNKAFEQYQKALKNNQNKTYNIACYYVVKGDLNLAKINLLHAEQHNTLPNLKYLNEDKDLNNVRNETWFIELLERLRAKEETNKLA
ncbi:SIR2 family protein [Acinetobacter piscicola]|uniref:SIR2 family protein n=1 Tax=Acinetobacter piscicola TaxID=2006115 RepID=UPI001E40E62A|nr:tetratricopeptide repeat protein [Acinetobacter piscicola]